VYGKSLERAELEPQGCTQPVLPHSGETRAASPRIEPAYAATADPTVGPASHHQTSVRSEVILTARGQPSTGFPMPRRFGCSDYWKRPLCFVAYSRVPCVPDLDNTSASRPSEVPDTVPHLPPQTATCLRSAQALHSRPVEICFRGCPRLRALVKVTSTCQGNQRRPWRKLSTLPLHHSYPYG
jgi:hypothetical protein